MKYLWKDTVSDRNTCSKMDSNAFFENVKNANKQTNSVFHCFVAIYFLHILPLYYQARFVNATGLETCLFFELTFYTFEM